MYSTRHTVKVWISRVAVVIGLLFIVGPGLDSKNPNCPNWLVGGTAFLLIGLALTVLRHPE